MTTLRRTTRAVRRAFTLVELLVVITVLALLLIIVLPAIARILESNNYAGAVNAVTAMLTRVSERGVDGGVAVLFDPHTQRTTLVPLELHARNALLNNNTPAIAYRPARGLSPVTLPAGMTIYALSFSHDAPSPPSVPGPVSPDIAWYPGERTAGTSGPEGVVNNWLFPRNHPQFSLPDYDPNNTTDSNHPVNFNDTMPIDNDANVANHRLRAAATFFIPFTAEGRAPGSALFAGGVRDAYIEYPDLPFNPTTAAHAPTDNEHLYRFDPQRYFPGNNANAPVLNPEVHIRPADRIAIVDLNRLIAETGIRAPWYVRTDNNGGFNNNAMPFTPTDKAQYEDEELVRRISEWVDRNGEFISISPNTGKVARHK